MDVYAVANLGVVMVFSTLISTLFLFTSLIPAFVLSGGLERYRELDSDKDEECVLLSSLFYIPTNLLHVVSRCGGDPGGAQAGNAETSSANGHSMPLLMQKVLVTTALAVLLVLDVGLIAHVSTIFGAKMLS